MGSLWDGPLLTITPERRADLLAAFRERGFIPAAGP